MPRGKKRTSLPTTLPSTAPSLDVFDVQTPVQPRSLSMSASMTTFTSNAMATPAPPDATQATRYNPYHRPMPERHVPDNLPPFLQQYSSPHSTPPESPSTANSENPPPRSSGSTVAAISPVLNLFKKKDFDAAKIPRHIRLEIAGAVGATCIGVGDIYAPLLRLLVPEPYDRFGSPAMRSIMAAPAPTLIANALMKKEAAPDQGPSVIPEVDGHHVEFSQSQTFMPSRTGPGRISTSHTPAMTSAFGTVHGWGAVFHSRAAWITSKAGLVGPVPRAALTVACPFEISAMVDSIVPAPPGPPSHAFLYSQQMAANQAVAAARATRTREAIALAIGHTVALKQLTGHGMGVAVVGSRFCRVLAVSDTVVVLELSPVISSSAFTIVNVLNHVFGDDLYNRMPNNFSCLPDRATGFLCGQPMTTTHAHFDEVLNMTSMQRFLDLFAASHAVVECATQRPMPVREAIIGAAANHPAPGYYFPSDIPRNDWAAVWALQLARVVIAEVSTEIFDLILRETTGVAEPLPGFMKFEPDPQPAPEPQVGDALVSSPGFSLELDPSQHTKLVVDQYTGVAKIVSGPPPSPTPAQKTVRGHPRKGSAGAKAPKARTKDNALQEKAPKVSKPRKPRKSAASTGRSTPMSEINLPLGTVPACSPAGIQAEVSM